MKQLRILTFALLTLIGCKEQEDGLQPQNAEGGKTLPFPAETVADQMVLERFPDAKIVYFKQCDGLCTGSKRG